MSLKDLIFLASKAMPKTKILLTEASKDDAVDSIAYLIQSANMANQMPGANAIITNLKDPTEEDECVFERTERRSHETE